MNKILAALLLSVLTATALEAQGPGNASASAATEPLMLPLWETPPPQPPPGLSPDPQPERMDDEGTVFNVTVPGIAVHLPPRERANGMALIVCPGGSYSKLGHFTTGMGAVGEFVPQGYAIIVLKYRTSPPVRGVYEASLADAKRAMRLVRHHAREWNIDPRRIGMIGGSAGGHLALNFATHSDEGDASAADPIEHQSCRADFLALVAPWPAKQSVSAFPIIQSTPPMFIAAAADDQIAPASFAQEIARACEEAGVASRLWIIPEGGHPAFTLGSKGKGAGWGALFVQWLKEQKLDQPFGGTPR
jgi:acetyl esterase/lipase